MSAERLREAARRMADRAAESPADPLSAEWIALARLLNVIHADVGTSSLAYKAAEILADAILGGTR